MEALLHWDFSPGLAVAKQVWQRFGSSVHFSPSPGAKEFFLVVSFTSASFSLSEDSVGLALQCCIGGDNLGFNVFKLSDRRFRFSVASSKVDHFIYGLKDRVWPDFVCHFSLFTPTSATPPSSTSPVQSGNSITFGSFVDPVFVDPLFQIQKTFMGTNFAGKFFANLSRDLLEHLTDLRSANYLEKEIL